MYVDYEEIIDEKEENKENNVENIEINEDYLN